MDHLTFLNLATVALKLSLQISCKSKNWFQLFKLKYLYHLLGIVMEDVKGHS